MHKHWSMQCHKNYLASDATNDTTHKMCSLCTKTYVNADYINNNIYIYTIIHLRLLLRVYRQENFGSQQLFNTGSNTVFTDQC